MVRLPKRIPGACRTRLRQGIIPPPASDRKTIRPPQLRRLSRVLDFSVPSTLFDHGSHGCHRHPVADQYIGRPENPCRAACMASRMRVSGQTQGGLAAMNGCFSAWRRGFRVLWVAGLVLAPAFAFSSTCFSADPPAIPKAAARAMQDRDYATAVEAIEAALTQPDQPHDYLRYLKGRALALDGRFEAAVAAFEQMAEQSPDSPWARRARFAAGWASAANRRFEQAATIYRAEAEKPF